jgi:hypothetical protein
MPYAPCALLHAPCPLRHAAHRTSGYFPFSASTLTLNVSYETTHSWNSEPQNIESAGGGNDEVWNRCALTISD